MTSKVAREERLISILSLLGSAGLVAALFACYMVFNSQLALAQAGDSFLDVFSAAILTWTVTVAAQRPDKEHPFGHSRAEPIGGLVVAVIAGVLAIEVARSAIEALLTNQSMRVDWLLVVAFGSKTVFKTLIVLLSGAAYRRRKGPAMKALKVDARNDILVSLLAIGGFFAARSGWTSLDSWLALPVALWIGWSGIELARDNIRYLMGEAPPEPRQSELQALAGGVPGVIGAHDLRAHFLGTELQVHIHILVAPNISVQQAHDIGEAVRMTLESEPDVGHCSVHIDAH